MERLPTCLFNHILDIYSGKSNFPGNLACASKRCKALCDTFKDEKLLLEGRVLVRVHLYASYLNTPVHKRFFSNVASSDGHIELPNYDFLLDGFEGQFKIKDGWKIEKMTLMLVTKSKKLVTEIDWSEPRDYGSLEKFNHFPEDVFGWNGDRRIQNYSFVVVREYNEEAEIEGSLVIWLLEWESSIHGGHGGSTKIGTLMENWDKVIVLN